MRKIKFWLQDEEELIEEGHPEFMDDLEKLSKKYMIVKAVVKKRKKEEIPIKKEVNDIKTITKKSNKKNK